MEAFLDSAQLNSKAVHSFSFGEGELDYSVISGSCQLLGSKVALFEMLFFTTLLPLSIEDLL
jgi:hypothetical protein